MKIRVTKKDISKGICGSSFSCPVALAIKRTLGINLGVDAISIDGDNRHRQHQYKTPASVRKFLYKFDETGKGEPFTFSLPVRTKL